MTRTNSRILNEFAIKLIDIFKPHTKRMDIAQTSKCKNQNELKRQFPLKN